MRAKRSVLQLDRDTLEVIAEFESIADAGRAMYGDPSTIRLVCEDHEGKRDKHSRHWTAYGYAWRYKEEHNET
ncbi:MAG: hypothetical protein J6S50_05630 [Oscillospiraceae bacterium]|nr:hypothetical protein [Lachnospiraceae bacterium]MBO7727976.1 hypothetical protein [Oscillospiraceae bacterium]